MSKRHSQKSGKQVKSIRKAENPAPRSGVTRLVGLVALCLAIVILLLVFTTRNYYLLTLLSCLFIASIVWIRRARFIKRCTLPVILLSAYMLLVGVSAFWADAPELFIEEYAKLLMAFAVFLSVLLLPKNRQSAINKTMWLLAGSAAIIALMSVEAATSGLMRTFAYRYLGASGLMMGFEEGTRLTGMFGNPNISAGILAIGILCSVSLAETASKKLTRAAAMTILSLCAYCFLLNFSIGGTAFFALSIIVCLIAARDRCIKLLRIMLIAAIPAVLCAYIAFPCFDTERGLVPLFLALANAAVVLLADRFLFVRADAPRQDAGKRGLPFLCAAVAVIAVYLMAAFSLTGGCTFGDSVSRSAYLSAGEYGMDTEADGDVQVTVRSQNREQLLTHTYTMLYYGAASQAEFTVPDDSLVCYFIFAGETGVTLSSATLSDGHSIKLGYTLLPGFIANRLQGLFANQNALQRLAFFDDGFKLMSQRPLFGGSLGYYENRSFSVQEFYYSSRYVHNHYIQMLVDNGIVGLALYVGLLVSLFAAFLRRRVRASTPAFAALLACLVMVCGHAFVEVSLSFAAYLPFAFALFALISLPCDEDGEKAPAPARAYVYAAEATRWGTALLGSVYAVLFLLCIIADSVSNSNAATYEEYLEHQQTAAEADIFHRATYRNYYISVAVDSGLDAAMNQAEEFCEAMQDDEVSAVVVHFYLYDGQYSKAMTAANAYLDRMPLAESVWVILFQTFSDYYDSLSGLSGDRAPSAWQLEYLSGSILALCDRLEAQNAGQIRQIRLGDELEEFVSSLSVNN